MTPDKKEVYRYMGYGRTEPDENIKQLADICLEEVMNASECRHISRRFPLYQTDEGNIKAAGITLNSRSLSRNLAGCSEVLFFAATLGNNVDRVLNRYSRLQISKAVVFQAAAAAYIEAYCDECQTTLAQDLFREKLFLRPRFSPGYGDLPLSVQPDFLNILDAQKTTGIILSEGGAMIPEKSVTAIIGISSDNTRCHTQGCEACSKKDCLYKR